jgi:hypothetical protein
MEFLRFNRFRISSLLTFLFLFSGILYTSAQEESEIDPYTIEENQKCFVCHAHVYFSYYNDYFGHDIKERMNPYYIVDSAEFYKSNHRTFMCTDCHSYSYSESFPHANELRFEPMGICSDCHEGDEIWEMYCMDCITDEYLESVHSETHSEEFTCWMCHDPHSYHITARNTENLLETIRYDNEICLDCHGDQSKIGLLSDRLIYDMLNQHEWLPNNRLHFQNVRCIECHARVSDTLLVAHLVQPKEKAVKLCVECHSQNSLLTATLFKHLKQETREKQGFLNAAILNQGYVIGANRNYFLNFGSLVIFGLVMIGITIHAILRRIYPKN